MRISFLCAAVLVCRASSLCCQSVPLATFELVLGAGGHSVRVDDRVVYTDNVVWTARAGASMRLSPSWRTAPYMKVDIDGAAPDKVELIQCIPAPSRPCLAPFPSGPTRTLGFGIRSALTRSILVGGLLGIGQWGTRGSRTDSRNADADVTMLLTDHVGIIGAARYITWLREGARHWYAPITVGVQVNK